jgi:hypothetical protein
MADALLVTSLKEPCRVSKRFTTKRIHELEHAKCEDGGQHIQYEVLCYVLRNTTWELMFRTKAANLNLTHSFSYFIYLYII